MKHANFLYPLLVFLLLAVAAPVCAQAGPQAQLKETVDAVLAVLRDGGLGSRRQARADQSPGAGAL